MSPPLPTLKIHHVHVQLRILPHYLDFCSLLVKIILTTQLASTLAIPVSRRFSNTVIDPLFRRLNNSLFPDKALFSGAAVVAV